MEPDQKKRLKIQIQKKIEDLKVDIKNYAQLTRPIAPDSAIGRLSRMEAINNKSINEAALKKSKNRLSRLERALKMIEHPEFGLCRECEEPIPFARLKAIPETDLCVQCSEMIT